MRALKEGDVILITTVVHEYVVQVLKPEPAQSNSVFGKIVLIIRGKQHGIIKEDMKHTFGLTGAVFYKDYEKLFDKALTKLEKKWKH